MEDLHTFFEHAGGTGILAIAHADGRANAAMYARPRIMDDGSVALIMQDRAIVPCVLPGGQVRPLVGDG